MQRIFNYDKWTSISEGGGLKFGNTRPRKVRLEVNAPDSVALSVADADGVSYFLALVAGRDTVEFYSRGSFTLVADGACWVYTADGDDISAVVDAPVSFTKIATRRSRNPELERIAFEMSRNMNRRLEQQADELSKLFAISEAARSAQFAAAVAAATDRIASGSDDGRELAGASDTETS
ncbi:MAG: hypothetical protein [Microviridae sp.]|nr:MAG: hypothetical protein [Microviridae sp.]